MEDPFQFRKNHENNNESDYLKGRNEFQNSEHAKEAAGNPYQKLPALLDAAKINLDNDELYPDNDPITSQRKDLLSFLVEELSDLDASDMSRKRQREIETWLDIIMSEGEVFTQSEIVLDIDPATVNNRELPYDLISGLYNDIDTHFHRKFFSDLDALDVIPEEVSITDEGIITSATFSFLANKKDCSLKFNETFPNSDRFYFVYRYDPDNKPHNSLILKGKIDPDTEEHSVDLLTGGSVS